VRAAAPEGEGRSIAGVPVLDGSELVGVLRVGSHQPHHFCADDLRLLERAADRIGAALKAAHLAGQLHHIERQAQAVLDTAGDGIVTIDESGRILMVNRAGCQLFRYREEDLVGRQISALMPEPHRSRHQEYIARFLRTGEHRILGRVRELEVQRSDGTLFPIELHVTEVSDGGDRLFTGVLRDITDRRRTDAQLRQQALHDPLTGLANRVLFRDRLNVALTRQQHQHTRVSVLFLDLDRFKVINDSLGHPAGDRLLEQVAGRLSDAVRPTDTISRFGGDEFAVLVDHLDTSVAPRVAKRLLTALSEPFGVHTHELTVSASIGIARSDRNQGADDLLRDADAALYRAKDTGGNRYEIFDGPLRRSVRRRLNTENELRHALTHDQIEVFYQPERSLTSGTIDCVEALARWRHPDRGLLPACEFIAIAEETGLIVSLGNRVLKLAALQQQNWPRESLEIAVNLSPQELSRPNLPAELASVGFDPGKLWVEVTETTLMTNLTPVADRLQELRELGVRVAIDDFGTGYSSLSHLRRLPIDAMKIDKAFVDRLGVDPDDTAIVTAVINLGQQMGIRVIAEGVETERQLNLLTDLGCHYAQGHHIAAASAADEIYPMIRQSADDATVHPAVAEPAPDPPEA
jgi:diguanylate cyclase (GGDEF)-like protein/PAS domain S-box-containing protein